MRFFLRFLEAVGVERERLWLRLHIHETADADEATRYWGGLLGFPETSFYAPAIKRHEPKTNRKNVDPNYRGCLQITVLESAELYRRIEGWAFGAMLGWVRPEVSDPVETAGGQQQLVRDLRACARGERTVAAR